MAIIDKNEQKEIGLSFVIFNFITRWSL